MTNELNTLNIQGCTVKKITLDINQHAFYRYVTFKFSIKEDRTELINYSFNLPLPESFLNDPGFVFDKIQLKELRKFIDEALEEIEKSENVL